MRAESAASRWRAALLAGLVLGIVFGVIEGFSIFSVAFAADLHVGRSAAATIFTTYLLAGAVLAPLAGTVVDRVGPRRVITAAFPIFGIGVAACAAAQSVWQLYAIYDVLIAATAACLINAAQVLVRNGYPERRGKAVGIAYACLGVGDFLIFTFLARVVTQASWRIAYVAGGIIVVVAAAVFCLLSRRLSSAPKPAIAPAPSQPRRSIAGRPLMFLFIAAVLASTADFFVFQHTVPFLMTRGYADSAAGFVLGLTALGYVAGQLGAGALSDRYTREAVGVGAAVLYAICLGGLWLSTGSAWMPIVVVLGLGAGVGGIVGSGSAAIGDLFAGRNLGRVSGILQVAGTLGASVGTSLGALSFDLTGTYAISFLVATGCVLIWTAAIWIAAPRRTRGNTAAASDAVPTLQMN